MHDYPFVHILHHLYWKCKTVQCPSRVSFTRNEPGVLADSQLYHGVKVVIAG